MLTSSTRGTALITGASAGIGALYADRLARRGYDLILVARSQDRLGDLAKRLGGAGRRADVIAADLSDKADLARVEARLRTDERITLLVNNAGVAAVTRLLDSDVEAMDHMISLNVRALTRLTYAAAPGFVARRGGTIINIASIVGVAPEMLNGVYGASKAYVIALSQSLHKELSGQGVRVQAVLPGATDTEIWEKVGRPVKVLPNEIVMRAEDMVDAALAGLDQGELITIPSLPDIADWQAFEAARQRLKPGLSRKEPAARYKLRTEG